MSNQTVSSNVSNLYRSPNPKSMNGKLKDKHQNKKHNSSKISPNDGGLGGGSGETRFDARFKVLMLGNAGVGKTSLIRSMLGETFVPSTISTIGIDLVKRIFIVDNYRIQLEIWDTAGQEQYNSIVKLHFREAKGFVIVYDMTDEKTFDQIRKYWLRSVDQILDEPVPVLFAANKSDMTDQRKVSKEDGEKLAFQQAGHGYFETSAKTGENVMNLFQKLAEAMVATWGAPKRWYEMNGDMSNGNEWPNQVPFRQTIQLTNPSVKPERVRCCNLK